jgi:hypothetical protein
VIDILLESERNRITVATQGRGTWRARLQRSQVTVAAEVQVGGSDKYNIVLRDSLGGLLEFMSGAGGCTLVRTGICSRG